MKGDTKIVSVITWCALLSELKQLRATTQKLTIENAVLKEVLIGRQPVSTVPALQNEPQHPNYEYQQGLRPPHSAPSSGMEVTTAVLAMQLAMSAAGVPSDGDCCNDASTSCTP
jgi:hypothetical protein